jgi:hypothetical protein
MKAPMSTGTMSTRLVGSAFRATTVRSREAASPWVLVKPRVECRSSPVARSPRATARCMSAPRRAGTNHSAQANGHTSPRPLKVRAVRDGLRGSTATCASSAGLVSAAPHRTSVCSRTTAPATSHSATGRTRTVRPLGSLRKARVRPSPTLSGAKEVGACGRRGPSRRSSPCPDSCCRLASRADAVVQALVGASSSIVREVPAAPPAARHS